MAAVVLLMLFISINWDISASVNVTSMSTCRQGGRLTTCRGPVPRFPPKTKLAALLIDQCTFDVLPNSTFVNVDELTTLIVNCYRPIKFKRGWSLPLSISGVVALELAQNFIAELPEGSFCHTENLELVMLEHNLIENPEVLGLSDDKSLCKVAHNLGRLNLAHNQIRSLPDGAFSQLQNLYWLQLSNNDIEFIHPMAFRNLTSLRLLDLLHNRLSFIGDTVFLTILQLESLDLAFNFLNDSIFDAIRPLVELVALHVGNNQIQTLNKETMLRLSKLSTLSINNNLISALPPFCFSNMKLSFLDMGSNDFDNFRIEPHHFVGLKYLYTLFLSNTSISAIAPNAFANMTKLRTLNLSQNKMKTMPNISGLNVLRYLNVSYNEIEQVQDDDFVQQRKLNELDISHNKLKRISKLSMRNFDYILMLNLSYNQIDAIEPGTFTSYRIPAMQLDNNRLTSITGVFGPATSLETLNLSTNHLTTFSYFDFSPTLQELQLDNNKIETIAVEVAPQNNLRFIDLSNNRLTSLRHMQVPSSFETLHLDNNNISSVEPRTFAAAYKWRYLSMRNNSLKNFCRAMLPPFEHQYIYRATMFISGNPFQCTCEFSWLLNAILNSTFRNSPSIPDLERTSCIGETPLSKEMELSTVKDNILKDNFWCKTGVGAVSDSNSCQCPDDGNTIQCTLECPRNCTCYRKYNWSRVVTRCQNAGLTSVPNEAPKETTTMVIKGNSIKMLRANEFSNFRKLYSLHAQRINLRYIEDFAFNHLLELKILHLDFNQLQTLSKDTFAGLTNLQNLFLNNNQLQTIDENVFQPLETLIVLYLRNNRLVRFPVWNLSANTKLNLVTVDNNPWSCDCEFVEKFRKWLLGSSDNSLAVSVRNVTCQMSTDMSTIPLVTIKDTVCLKMDNKTAFSVTVTIVGSIIGIFVPSIVLAILIFYYRKEIQVLVYARYGIRMFRRGPQKDSNLNSDDKPYDVFVSYSSLDDDFLLEHILPGLETEVAVPYRVCIHQRDFTAGAYITDAILEAVARSKATLLLLSNNFMESEWCRFEFKAAHLQMLKDPQSKVVVVLLQPKLPKNIDPEIKLYLKTNTYLCWGDKLFWKRLYFALPKPSQAETEVNI